MSLATANHRVIEAARHRARFHASQLRLTMIVLRPEIDLPNVVANDVFEGRGFAGAALRNTMWAPEVTADELRANELTREETYEAVRGWNEARS